MFVKEKSVDSPALMGWAAEKSKVDGLAWQGNAPAESGSFICVPAKGTGDYMAMCADAHRIAARRIAGV